MRTSYLSGADLASAHLGHTEDVAATVREALGRSGPDARVCVLPEGPQTIPYVRCGLTAQRKLPPSVSSDELSMSLVVSGSLVTLGSPSSTMHR